MPTVIAALELHSLHKELFSKAASKHGIARAANDSPYRRWPEPPPPALHNVGGKISLWRHLHNVAHLFMFLCLPNWEVAHHLLVGVCDFLFRCLRTDCFTPALFKRGVEARPPVFLGGLGGFM